MYSIYVDNQCIFDSLNDDDTLKVVSPKLIREDNCSGSLEFTLPPTNVGFEWIHLMTSDIVVKCKSSPYNDAELIWMGRATKCDTDFYKQKKYYCEGALSFLIDTLQPTSTFEGTVLECLTKILDEHNGKVGQNRRIMLGMVSDTSTDPLILEFDYNTSLDAVLSGIIEKTKGHVQISFQGDGTPLLNYYSEWLPVSGQTMTFGENLLDLTQNFDVTDICTAIIPRATVTVDDGGNSLSEEVIIDISTVNDGSKVLVNTDLLDTYGYVERLVEFEDVSTPEELLEAAQKYFSDTQFDEMSIEVSAFDLSYLNYQFYTGGSAFEPISINSPFEVLHMVHCVSAPHGLDRSFPVTKIELSLNDPSDMSITLNSDKSVYLTSNVGSTTVNINKSTTNNIIGSDNNTSTTLSLCTVAGDSLLFLGGGSATNGNYQADPWSVLGWIRNQYSPYPDLHAQNSNIQITYNMATNGGHKASFASVSLGSTIIIFINGWMSEPIKIPSKLVSNSSSTMPGDLNSITSVQLAFSSIFVSTSYINGYYTDVGISLFLYPFGPSGPPFGLDGVCPLTGNPSSASGPCFVAMHNISSGATSASSSTVFSSSGGEYKTAIVCFKPELESLAEFYYSEVQNVNNNGYKTWTVIGASSTPTVPLTQIDKMSWAGGYKYGDGTLKYSIASGGVGITPWDVPYVGMHKNYSYVSAENEWKFAVEKDGIAGMGSANVLEDATGTFKGKLVNTTGVHSGVISSLYKYQQAGVTPTGDMGICDMEGLHVFQGGDPRFVVTIVSDKNGLPMLRLASVGGIELCGNYFKISDNYSYLDSIKDNSKVGQSGSIYIEGNNLTFKNGVLVDGIDDESG